jgi:A/G-specific adenine glycosylase
MRDTDDCQKKQKKFIESINYSLFTGVCGTNVERNMISEAFQNIVYGYFDRFGRDFVWRHAHDPYHIVVSEIMLQQTQTGRVIGKFEQFVERFPSWFVLADASWHDVLAAWQGLGYSRRAQALHTIAHKVVTEYCGQLPANEMVLQTFPGIGQATAASICAFAFNMPTVFIETNIRSVFLHFFFHTMHGVVRDKEIIPLIAHTIDQKNPRQWYYALMDYGVTLKRLYPELNKKSAHYMRQSKFEGSDRQIRGRILKALLENGPLTMEQLVLTVERDASRVQCMIDDLIREAFIEYAEGVITIRSHL